jgi:hypothetical protein
LEREALSVEDETLSAEVEALLTKREAPEREVLSAMWELVNRWTDERTRLFDDTRKDDCWDGLNLPDIHFRELRRHLKNSLKQRTREDSPDKEISSEELGNETPDGEKTHESVLIDRERVREIIERHARPRDPDLVDEERRVLELIAEGVGERQACREAEASTRVVERIRDRERRKRGVR